MTNRKTIQRTCLARLACQTRFSRRSFLSAAPLLLVPLTPAGAADVSASLDARLLAEVERLEIADTHEHFFEEKERVAQHVDFFSIVQGAYTMSDLISAGMPADASRLLRDEKAPEAERWRAFEPHWKLARFTGYGQALRIAMRDLYGVGEISAATIGRLNEAIRARNKPGLYRHVLRERARIRFCVEDDSCGGCVQIHSTQENFQFMVLSRRFDKFIAPATPKDIAELERMTDTSITTLPGLKQALERNFAQNLANGMRAIKVALAYSRELRFEETAEAAAESDFQKLMQGGAENPEGFRKAFVRPYRRLEDYMFHQVMRLADGHRIPVQIHTGAFAGTGGVITNSKPTHLINTFLLYPRIQFDIFHLSFPYQDELGALAKSFPNVYADFCWAHVLSPVAAQRSLDEYLETVPLNKMLAFGGDYKYVELTYAHAKMARQVVARVLAAKVQNKFCTEAEAVSIGKMLLYENAARLFSWRDA
jgi:predicted TIM-barrel fold metal-dependent hydrolase